jgi:HK97 gp10 family phage protein
MALAAMKVTGLDEVLGRMRGLAAKVQKKVAKDAVGKAGQIILWDAKGRVRKVSGLLRKSLGRKVKVYRNTGVATAVVGPRRGFKVVLGVRVRGKAAGKTYHADPTHYSHLVEKGTNRSQAFPFLGAALEASRGACEKAMADTIMAAVQEAGR